MIAFESFEDYLLNEILDPIFCTRSGSEQKYKDTMRFLVSEIVIPGSNFSRVINEYNNGYETYSEMLSVDEVIDVYHNSLFLRENHDLGESEYTEENFKLNGFIKSEFVIHLHDPKYTRVHFDLRFKTEFGTSAYSFVIMRTGIPEGKERYLAKQQPMHPPQWVDLDHTKVGEGEKQGSVTTVDRGTIFYKKKQGSFVFFLEGKKYRGAFHLVNIRNSLFLLFQAENSILSSKEEHDRDWGEYAHTFLDYMKKRLHKTLGDKFVARVLPPIEKIKIASDSEYVSRKSRDKLVENSILFIPNTEYCASIFSQGKSFSPDCPIRSYEDILRMTILRDVISPNILAFLQYKKEDFLMMFQEDTRMCGYFDEELEQIKKADYASFARERFIRMVSDIYLGHKYYGSFDVERYVCAKIAKLGEIG